MADDCAECIRVWAGKYGVKAVFFDLDDTLIKTRQIFFRRMDEAIDFVCAHNPGLDNELLRRRQHEVNTEGYSIHSVNPVRWDYVYKRLAKEFPAVGTETWEKALEITLRIYKDVPEVFDGAYETLDCFRRAKVVLILVTHGSLEWTQFKLVNTGLKKYFADGRVVCIDPNSFKTSAAWLEAANVAGIRPLEAAVVGDNLNGDIISARGAGIQHLFWIDAGDGWAPYRKGTVPKGTYIIKDVNRLIECIRTRCLS